MKLPILIIALVALLLAPLDSIADTTIFSQDFTLNNSSSGNQVIGSTTTSTSAITNVAAAWSGFVGSIVGDTASADATNRVFVAGPNLLGNPNTSFGYLAITPNVAKQALVASTTFTSGLDFSNATITWNMGNTSANDKVQLMVQVAGNWYASSTLFSNSGFTASTFASATSVSVAQSLTFSITASNWQLVTFTASTASTGGSVALTALESDLSTSTVTGIGFLATNSTVSVGSTMRLDTLAVTSAIPEPATAGLLLGMAGIVFAAGVRRRD